MMNRPYDMYRKGGLKDEGGEIDEVSGNEVPIGGTKKGVRDDIEANLSEGEFVMPEDATRYHGLKTLMGMRQEAKAGLKQMEAMGLMGNADEATLPDDIPFGLGDLVVVELDADGMEKEVNMAVGGMAAGQQGETVSLMGGQQPVPVRQRPQPKVTFDEIMGDAKIEFKEYRNAEGQSLMVPFIGDVPMYPIPEGYTLYTGEGGVEEPAVPEVPTTGMEQFTDNDDDRPSAITQQQPKSIDWENLSDADFINTANSRNGFGRNLVGAVASMMNPLVGLAVNGLMRYEDQKVLDMAKTRLANLPANSPERAKYEKLIKEYEARNSGLFGGIINKMITKVGDLLGLDKEQTKQAKVNNMISHGKNNPAGPNGQVTADAVESSNSGTVVDPTTGKVLTIDEYEKAIKDAESTDPNIANPAKETLTNHTVNLVGEELANFVDPQILNRIQIGSAERTPEQTRTDIVNAVYQNVDAVKTQLDTLSPSQQEFLDYNAAGVMPNEVLQARTIVDDPTASSYARQIAENTLREAGATGVNNYLDVVDTLREDVSQILPMETEREVPQTRLISENLAEGETQRRGEFGLTPESRAASVERRKAGTAMGMLDTSESTATPITRDFTTTPTQTQEQARQDQVNALINVGIQPYIAEATIPKVDVPQVTVTQQPDVNALEGPEATVGPALRQPAGTVTSVYEPEPAVKTAEEQMKEVFTPTVTTTKGVGTGRDVADMPVTPAQVSYSTSGIGQSAAQSEADRYDPRIITQVPSEQVTTPVPITTTAQMDTPSLPSPVAPIVPPTTEPSSMVDPATSFKPKSTLSTSELITRPTIEDPTTPKTETQKLREMLTGTKPTTDTTTIAGFEAEDPRSQGKPATLKDVVPETPAALGEPVKPKETFSDAFAEARKAGKETFTFEGKSFTTETKEEKEAKQKKEDNDTQVTFNPKEKDTSGTTKSSVVNTNAVNKTGSSVTIGQKSKTGQDAGDGFVWEKKEGTNALTRKYVGKKDSGGNDDGGGASKDDSGGGCCFIMLEARYGNGTMDEVVRRYRDEHMTDRNRRGYYKVAEVLVPLMRKSPIIKWLVTKTFADPLVSYGKYYYGQNKHGVLYSPVKSLWMKLFDTVGGDTEFIRENGEVV